MQTRVVVSCASCYKELPLLPTFIPNEEFRQWFGTVCRACGRAYCSECVSVTGPGPCPACGVPTTAAQLCALREAGIVP